MVTGPVGTSRRIRELWVDARFGIAGDMLLAALLDAGADLAAVRRAVAAVIGDAVSLNTSEVRRAGQRATLVDVRLTRPDQPHRAWAEIRALLQHADLAPRVREGALATFEALAAAESRVHGVPADEVHFHEVGAWDSIADIVGVCAALADLDVGTVSCTDIVVGEGTVAGAHGLLPVPPPAVLELVAGSRLSLRALPTGAPDAAAEPVGELATPTGVALLAALTDGCSRAGVPALASAGAVGVGAGQKDIPGWANVVRVVLGPAAPEVGEPAGPGDELRVDWLTQLSANVDDLDPRAWPGVLTALLTAGAVDAWLTPILMKKGRPGHTVSALVAASPQGAATDAVRRALLAHTSTLGVREATYRRAALPRAFVAVPVRLGSEAAGSEGYGSEAHGSEAPGSGTTQVASGEVRIKVGYQHGRIVQATPEFEDCATLAAASGHPVAQVLAAASAAADAAGLRPGQPFVADDGG